MSVMTQHNHGSVFIDCIVVFEHLKNYIFLNSLRYQTLYCVLWHHAQIVESVLNSKYYFIVLYQLYLTAKELEKKKHCCRFVILI
jgi:hypothetical protein